MVPPLTPDTYRRHEHLLDVGSSAVVVVDIQEKFRSHITGWDAMVAQTQLLLRTANELGVPVLASEQYPKGLGPTVEELTPLLAGVDIVEKLEISTTACRPFQEQLASLSDVTSVVVVGIEAHVCVSQTVHDLLAAGYTVHVVEDAIASRDANNKRIALNRFREEGVVVTSVEMAIFEWLMIAGTDSFRTVQGFIKEHDRVRAGETEKAVG